MGLLWSRGGVGIGSSLSVGSSSRVLDGAIIALYLGTLLPLHSQHEFTTVNEQAYEV